MSNLGDDLKTIRILPFDDKVKDFRKWHLKFKAAAELKGYADVLVGKETVPNDSEVLDISTDEGKAKQKVRNANQRAYTELILACHGDLSFKIVANAVTDELSGGDAKLAWKNLKNQFLPRTSANKSILVTDFWKSRLRSLKKDPEIWINDLEVKRERLDDLGYEIKNDALMIHILNHLPVQYDVAVHHLLKRMDNLVDPLEMSEIKGDLCLVYMTMKFRSKKVTNQESDEDSNDSDEDESAFVATGGKFKGRCYKCGRFEHKSSDCPNSKGPQGDRNGQKLNGKCFYCGKWGHRKRDCKKLLQDRKERERANMAHEDFEEGELAFTTLVVKNKMSRKDADNNLCGNRKKTDIGLKELASKDIKITKELFKEKDVKKKYEAADNETAFAALGEEKEKTKKKSKDDGRFDMLTKDTWLIDSGASSHMTNTTDGMIHLRKIDKKVKVGSGEHVQVTHIGDKKGSIVQKNGSKKDVYLQNVLVVPEMYCNLISMTQLMEKGARVEGKSGQIWVNNGKKAILFDRKIKSGNGTLLGIKVVERKEKLQRNKTTGSAHHLFGHAGHNITRETARKYGLSYVFSEEVCESCAITKAAQKRTKKISTFSIKEVGGRIQFDTSSVKNESAGGSKHWQMFVDEATGFKTSYTGSTKSSLYQNGMNYLNHLKKEGIEVKRFRCDDAGENKKFEKMLEKTNFLPKFEYTGRSTPQHNGMVERAFATITGRVRAMMKEAGVEGQLKTKLWAECVRTATILDGLLVDNAKNKSKHEIFFGRKSELISHLRSFGEIGIVFDYKGKKMRKKLEDRGFASIFVGYAPNHSGDVYRMFNLVTNRVLVTRDVKFLGKYYGKWKKRNRGTMSAYLEKVDLESDLRDVDTEDSPDNLIENGNDCSRITVNNMVEDTTENETISQRAGGVRTRSMGGPADNNNLPETGTQLHREMRKINDTWNPTLSDVVEFALVGGTDDMYENPKTFDEAWNRPNVVERENGEKPFGKNLPI